MDGSELQDDENPADGGSSGNVGNTVKRCLLRWAIVGADKAMMDRHAWRMKSSVDIGEYVSSRKCHRDVPGGNWMDSGPNSRASHAWRIHSGFGRKGCSRNRRILEEAERFGEGDYHGLDSAKVGLGFSDDWIDDPTDVSRSSMINLQTGGYPKFPLSFPSIFPAFLSRFIGFQFSLFVSFLTFPIRASYFSIMFLMFPFQTLVRLRRYLAWKLTRLLVVSSTTVAAKAQTSIKTAFVMFGCALFWSSYVCMLLFGFLVSSLVLGGLMMRVMVEKPFQAIEDLNFDYTKSSPTAFVTMMDHSSPGMAYPVGLEAGKTAAFRVIPYGRKLQVRVEFLSASGRVTASSSRASMLRFKSQPVRFAQSIIRSVPILAGLQSESQNLNIRMAGLRGAIEPTVAFRVILEQRAEYKDGTGAPEVYEASISVESELPAVKRVMWQYRRTIYVWTCIVLFLFKLLLALIFFPRIVLPGRRAGKSRRMQGN